MSGIIGLQSEIDRFRAAYVRRRTLDLASWLVLVGRKESEEEAVAFVNGAKPDEVKRLEKEMSEFQDKRRIYNEAQLEAATRKQDYERFRDSIPLRYRAASLSDFDKTLFSSQIPGMLDGASAIILGTNGIGKTRFAWALASHWASKDERCIVMKAQELLSQVKGWQSQGSDTYASIRSVYGQSLPHLIIDEIDKIYGTQADFLLLSFLVDIRYEDCLQTIILGNKPERKDVADLLGSSTFSRLSGDGASAQYIVSSDRRKEEKR